MSMKETVRAEPVPILIGKVGIPPQDDEATKEWPILMELLLPKYDHKGRMTRESGTLSVRCEGSLFRITITCPTEDAQASMDYHQLVDILTTVERWLLTGKANWAPTWKTRERARQRLKDSI